MAEEGSTTVLELLQQGNELGAAEEFRWLVSLVCPTLKRMTKEQEQELQLNPSKHFKKLRKVTGSEDAVRGLLKVLGHEGEAAYLLLESIVLLSSAPSFSKQIGDCGLADALLRCSHWLFPQLVSLQPSNPQRAPPLTPHDETLLRAAGAFVQSVTYVIDHSRDFYEQAMERRLLSAIMACFPWPGPPPRGRHNAQRNSSVLHFAELVSRAFAAFIDSEEKAHRLIESNTEVTAWLVRHIDYLTKLAEALVPKVLFDKEHLEIQEAAKGVTGRFRELMLDFQQLEEVERALGALLPHLEGGAKFQADGFLSLVHSLRWDVPRDVGFNGSGFTDLNDELQSVAALLSHDRRAFNSRFDSFYEGYRILSNEFPRVLVSRELLDVLTTGFLEKLKAPGRLSEDSRSILRPLKNALRTAQGAGFEPAAFDDVALPLLRHVEPALHKLGGMAFQHLLGALIECYKGGGERTRPAKVWSPLLVSILEMDIDQTALRFTWHFLAVLVAERTDFDSELLMEKGVNDGNDEPPVEGRPLPPLDKRKALAHEIVPKQRGRLFAPAWRVFTYHVDFGVSFGDRVEDVASVLLWCCAESALVEGKLLPKIGLVVRILALDYEQMSERCGRDATSAFVRSPWPDKCRPLAAILRLAFESTMGKPAARKALVEEFSRSGGLELCRAVVRDSRKPGVLNGGAPEEEDLQWVAEFRALCEELWGAVASRFGLDACSNPKCVLKVYETRKKEFRKCSACSRVQYCGRDCQVFHWKTHKKVCQPSTKAPQSQG